MIVNASGRTDIPAFYFDWFMNRLKEGWFDCRNPFAPAKISRIYAEDIDAFMFCTKNPIPMLPYLDQIDKPVLMDVTITGYHKELEPNVPDKGLILDAVRQLSEKLGKKYVSVRYDPIFISKRYTVDYHLRAFDKLCNLLDGYVEEIVISFLDEYKNVLRNQDEIGYLPITQEDCKRLAEGFLASANAHGIHVFTCHEGNLLEPYGISSGACFSQKKAYEMTGKALQKWKARDCGCVQMADIGVYNTCLHGCRYCYANFDEKKVMDNFRDHDPDSSLLVGHIDPNDEIKVRRK
ncbi:MAG: DUF1848 domain-containing protein [Ileibacterium sp.]|nr:DUF1848 domain-containing protein [Ileibacterium sp.]